MKQSIFSVQIVSDGILIEFTDGVCRYFPADTLREDLSGGPNYVFLNYDPSPTDVVDPVSTQVDHSVSEVNESVAH